MGNHVDTRNQRRTKVREHDDMARRRRASFKQYLKQVEEELLEDQFDELDDPSEHQDEQDDQV